MLQNLFKPSKTVLLICCLISILYLLVFYHNVFYHPNRYLFTSGGDGNYYIYAWHIKYDSSYTQFKGISYPYGESLIMDSLHSFSTIVKLVSNIFPAINNYTVGILNFLIFLSFIFGVLFLYLIFRCFSIPYYLSALAANSVCILSSQFLLLNPAGHYGLAFICSFPMGWYLLIRYFENKNSVRWSLFIILNIIFWAFTHVYLGCILLLFTLLTHIFKALSQFKSYFKSSKEYIYPAIQIFIPIIVILLFVELTDHHPNRVNLPFNTDYAASFNSIFTPVFSPIKPLYKIFFDLSIKEELSWDKIGNYIGLTSNVALIIFVVLFIYYIMIRQWWRILLFFQNNMALYLLSSVVLLIYSFAIPFRFLPHSFMDAFPFFRQFSSFGRFAWAFYYVMVVFGIVLFYKLLYNKLPGKILLYFLILINVIEGSSYHIKESSEIRKTKNVFNYNFLPENEKILASINKNEFQAILPLPYYFIYGLPFEKANSLNSIYCSMVASYYSGLPIMSTYYSRPSVSEALDLFKQLMPEPYKKNIPLIVVNRKDIAVVINNHDFNILNENEKHLLAKCRLFIKNAKYSIYDLSISRLMADNGVNYDSLYENIKQHYFQFQGLMVKDTTRFYVYNNFDYLNSKVVYRGDGAAQGIKSAFNLMLKVSTENMDTSCDYVISFWYYNHLMDQMNNTVVISEKDMQNSTLQLINYSPVDASIVDGWWYLSEFKFRVRSNKSMLSVYFHGDDYFEKWFAVDEFLIRPADIDVYRLAIEKGRKIVYLNNREFSY